MKVFKNILLVLFMNILLCNASFAVGGTVAHAMKEFLQPIFSLFIVIGMIYAAFFAYSTLDGYKIQRFSKLSKKRVDESKIFLVSHLSLGQNKSVDVIEINGQRLLLGVCSDKITLLKEFDKNSENSKLEDDIYSIKELDNDSEEESEQKIQNSKIDALYNKYMRGVSDK